MPNVTLAIDADLLNNSRAYARRRGRSLNDLIRELLARAVKPSAAWVDELAVLSKRAGGDSRGRRWTREELYDRKVLR